VIGVPRAGAPRSTPRRAVPACRDPTLGRADDQRGGALVIDRATWGHDRAHACEALPKRSPPPPRTAVAMSPRRGECGGEKRSRQKHLVHVPLFHALDDFGLAAQRVTCSPLRASKSASAYPRLRADDRDLHRSDGPTAGGRTAGYESDSPSLRGAVECSSVRETINATRPTPAQKT